MRDTSKDDKISGNRNTYGFQRGDILSYGRQGLVEVLRPYKYTVKVRFLSTGDLLTDYNWFFSIK